MLSVEREGKARVSPSCLRLSALPNSQYVSDLFTFLCIQRGRERLLRICLFGLAKPVESVSRSQEIDLAYLSC